MNKNDAVQLSWKVNKRSDKHAQHRYNLPENLWYL